VGGGEGGELAQPRPHRADHHPRACLPERCQHVGEVPGEAPIHEVHRRVVGTDLVVEEELHPLPLGRNVLPAASEPAEQLADAGRADGERQTHQPQARGSPGEHRPRSERSDDLVVPGVDDDDVRRVAGEVAGHRHERVRADRHQPGVHDLDASAGHCLLEHGLEEARQAEGGFGVSLCGGLAEHHHPHRARALLRRDGEGHRLPGESRREEAQREVRVRACPRLALHLAGNGEGGGVTHAEQPEQQLQPAEHHQWREHHRHHPEQTLPGWGEGRHARLRRACR